MSILCSCFEGLRCGFVFVGNGVCVLLYRIGEYCVVSAHSFEADRNFVA